MAGKKNKFNRYALIYCRIRAKHPNWSHGQIKYCTIMLGEEHNMASSEYDQLHKLLHKLQTEAPCHNRACKYCK